MKCESNLYSITCDEGTPVRMSKLHLLWTKLYLPVNIYLLLGETYCVGTLFECPLIKCLLYTKCVIVSSVAHLFLYIKYVITSS